MTGAERERLEAERDALAAALGRALAALELGGAVHQAGDWESAACIPDCPGCRFGPAKDAALADPAGRAALAELRALREVAEAARQCCGGTQYFDALRTALARLTEVRKE